MSDLPTPKQGGLGYSGLPVLLIPQVPTTIKDVNDALALLRELDDRHPESHADISNLYGGVLRMAEQLQAAAHVLGGAINKHKQRTAQDDATIDKA